MTLYSNLVLDWKGKYQLVVKNDKGLEVSFDAPIFFGGEESAMSPMDTILASLAACSSIHLLASLKEKEIEITSYKVEIKAERDEKPPRTFTSIHLNYVIKANGLSDSVLRDAIFDTENHLCSVAAMLRKAVPISSSYKIDI